MGAINIPKAEDDAMFEVASTILHLLQMQVLYGGLEHEDPYDHVRNFIEVCNPFSL